MGGTTTFAEWRARARDLLARNVAPEQAHWDGDGQGGLFATPDDQPKGDAPTVPRAFLSFAEKVACHTDPERWALLYQALWRLTHGEKHLLEVTTDPLVRRLELMEKAVRRDAHKTKAFVRFRMVRQPDGQEHYIAWHRPDYRVLALVGPFFQRRFASMRWTILTPQQTVDWDGEKLTYGPGLPSTEAPDGDELEDLWKTYYRSIFNPARIKLDMMKREMPVRHWATLPETQMIPQMLAEAEDRVATMLKYSEGSNRSAADFLPPSDDLHTLAQAAAGCQGCPLFQFATQTVFGEGSKTAHFMLVGEQPGDSEDLEGRPFVGPSGQLLDKALDEAGIDRGDVYVTNAVKHFKFEERGKRRIHKTPSVREVKACKPWLEHEIKALRPKAIGALGATAAKSLLGPGFTLKEGRKIWHDGPEGSKVMASYHPSAILRAIDQEQRDLYYGALVEDLTAIKKGYRA